MDKISEAMHAKDTLPVLQFLPMHNLLGTLVVSYASQSKAQCPWFRARFSGPRQLKREEARLGQGKQGVRLGAGQP